MARRTAIGLDIGTSVVRAVELSFGRDGVTLDRFGQVVLPDGAVRDGEVVDPEAVTAAIKELWSATRFGGKKVVLGVANQRVIVRQLDLPWMEQGELRKSLGFHVADFLPISVEESVLDFYPLEEITNDEGNRQLRGLLVAAQRDAVLLNVQCAEKAGLRVESVDLTSFAVLRAMGRQTDLTVGTEALIDVGARVTNIVVHSAGVPRFVRILLMGGQDVTDAVSEQLGVPLDRAEGLKQNFTRIATGDQLAMVSRTVATTAQDFVDEIRGSLDYYAVSSVGARVERIVISGGGSRLEGLAERLAASTRLPVVLGDPLWPLKIGRTGLDADQIEFIKPLAAVPVGLALGRSDERGVHHQGAAGGRHRAETGQLGADSEGQPAAGRDRREPGVPTYSVGACRSGRRGCGGDRGGDGCGRRAAWTTRRLRPIRRRPGWLIFSSNRLSTPKSPRSTRRSRRPLPPASRSMWAMCLVAVRQPARPGATVRPGVQVGPDDVVRYRRGRPRGRSADPGRGGHLGHRW